MERFLRLLCIYAFIFTASSQTTTFDLSGDWTVQNFNGSVRVPATVPGDIFSDLIKARVIGEPYYRFNDVNYRWVSTDSWIYSKTFTLPYEMLFDDEIFLICEGLDTIATITINYKVVAQTNNMFRKYIFPIKKFMNPKSQDQIVISFQASGDYARKMAQMYPYTVPWTVQDPSEIPYRNFIRREQATFAWDWGPTFLATGIWQNITMVSVTGALVESAVPVVLSNGPDWLVSVNVSFISTGPISGKISVTVDKFSVKTPVDLDEGNSEVTILLPVPGNQVDLWWPNGKGKQPLYNVTIIWQPDSDMSSLGKKTANPTVITKKIAFRKLQLVQDPVPDGAGNYFYFKINDVPIFVKGANWIPADSFESRVNSTQITKLLMNAVTANMNMIRNWGGGIYQREEFYDFCDKYGLMVWEEFMFACGMYPRDDDFLDNVRHEVKFQVRRLAHHPSVVVWAGNNENEVALGWFQETRDNRDMYVVDQVALYVDTIRSEVLRQDTSRPFLFSSPSNGPLSESPYVLRWGDTGSQIYGDVHFYQYDWLCTNESAFPNARFVSEFGWQSFPSVLTWSPVTDTSDLTLNSTLMAHRQHHPGGNDQISAQMKKNFKMPGNRVNPVDVFSNYIYLSQAVQALCIRAQTEHYRRGRDTPAHTMGALYWQFNDIWQAPTWSSLEYSGRWKMLHYFAKNFYVEVFISSFMKGNVYTIQVVNDQPRGTLGVINLTLYKYSDSSVVYSVKYNVVVPSLDSAYVVPNLPSFASNEVFALLTLSDTSGNILSNNFYLFAPLVQVTLPSSAIIAQQYTQVSPNTISLEVVSSQVAMFLWLESTILGHFSENGFILPGKTAKTVFFYADQNVAVDTFRNSISGKSVSDTI